MNQLEEWVEKMTSLFNSLKNTIEEGAILELIKPKIKRCTQLLTDINQSRDSYQNIPIFEEKQISRFILVCHETISLLGNRASDETLLFINGFCCFLSKNNKNKMAERYLSVCHNLLKDAQKDVRYIILNNHLATLVVLKRYAEAVILACKMIEDLELDVKKVHLGIWSYQPKPKAALKQPKVLR